MDTFCTLSVSHFRDARLPDKKSILVMVCYHRIDGRGMPALHSHFQSLPDQNTGRSESITFLSRNWLDRCARTHLGKEVGITSEFPIANSEKEDVNLLFTIGFLSRQTCRRCANDARSSSTAEKLALPQGNPRYLRNEGWNSIVAVG